ncbi:MAG: TatD family hydrolase [Candidatus Saccharicenans sp.]|nr:MAG: YchF/TatD family DNA exonuclease [Candidatus Aminicenantes bacterium]HEK85675.1 TatD family deoxyribonuclease [Candidatus Aminicenantes bacterium]
MPELKSPELVDSHAHLDVSEFNPDREEVLARAKSQGVNWVLCPLDACSEESLRNGLELQQKHENIFLAAGVHPHQAKDLKPKHLELIKKLAGEGKILAIGEIGLDFHYNFSDPEKQIEAFRLQLELASELKLPVIIHSRQAADKIIEAIEGTKFDQRGILHCFTENYNLARILIDRGFMISFSGLLTYLRADNIREAALKLPLRTMLVETDSPYLVPFPEKKTWKRNEPSFVVSTANYLAKLKNVQLMELAEITTRNFFQFFHLKKDWPGDKI